MLTICAWCNAKMRPDGSYGEDLAQPHEHKGASHGICPPCEVKVHEERALLLNVLPRELVEVGE